MRFTLNPLGAGTAAEIIGLDCGQAFAPDVWQDIYKAFLTYPVLIFRDQTMSAPQLAAFSRLFGPLESYATPGAGKGVKSNVAALRQVDERETPDQMLYLSPDDNHVLIMTNEVDNNLFPIGIVDNAEMWHSDASHKPDPYKAIIVHVLRNPRFGGDTEFCDLRAVYRALTPEIRAALDGRLAVHHWSKVLNPRFAGTLDAEAQKEGERIAAMIPEMLQPVVRTHPETGQPSLYLSPRFTLRFDGVPDDVSNTLLDTLFAFMDDSQFHYRHVWKEKDLMIWDNRCLNHRVRSYSINEVRRRHRVTVTGDRPFFAPGLVKSL